jgi:hypothetical protein
MMTGYEAFSIYNGLKLHFTQKSYDYLKYNGKSNISVVTFENRKDKFHFYKLSRKHQIKDDYINFLVANLLEDSKVWVGTLLSEECDIIYRQRQKVIQSMSYTFENECRDLFSDYKNPNDVLVTNGDYPVLLTKALRKEISPETLIILNRILNFLPMWNKNISDTIRWPDYEMKLTKYASFLMLDDVKYKLILKKVIL